MDGSRFDQLARSFSVIGSRRGLVRLLVTLPLTGAILALVDGEAADAARHRKRRKKRRKRRKRKGKGTSCRQACADGRPCCGGVCCEPSQVCEADATCCTPLPEGEACTAARAAGQACGTVSDGCGGSYICDCPNGTCQTCTSQDTCVPADGPCDNGNPCTIFDTCDDGVCTPGTAAPDGTPCAGGICCGGRCTAAACCPCEDPTQRCCEEGGTCIACFPADVDCGGFFGRPHCACICCSGSWIGAGNAGTCL